MVEAANKKRNASDSKSRRPAALPLRRAEISHRSIGRSAGCDPKKRPYPRRPREFHLALLAQRRAKFLSMRAGDGSAINHSCPARRENPVQKQFMLLNDFPLSPWRAVPLGTRNGLPILFGSKSRAGGATPCAGRNSSLRSVASALAPHTLRVSYWQPLPLQASTPTSLYPYKSLPDKRKLPSGRAGPACPRWAMDSLYPKTDGNQRVISPRIGVFRQRSSCSFGSRAPSRYISLVSAASTVISRPLTTPARNSARPVSYSSMSTLPAAH